MKRISRYILRVIIFIAVSIAFYLLVLILIGTITDYKPDDVMKLEITGDPAVHVLKDSSFTFLTWNIGFGGLGAEMDFFYDDGKMVRPGDMLLNKYTTGILAYLNSVDSINFILLQEVDKNSARTNKQDETKMIGETMSRFAASFGINYNVRFVPLPFLNPLGKVKMGQLTLSDCMPGSSHRYSYNSSFSWPKKLFMLDRCFVVSRFKLENGRELVVMNTHNSAYDADGKLREIEMPVIQNLMLEEYKKGNYVVAGGDWNQNPPEYDPTKVSKTYPAVKREALNSELFPIDWQIVYDPIHPTNREINTPLTTGETEVTIIDYFILSPNVQLEEIKVLSQNFQSSDHEPVYMKIRLK